MNGGAVGAERSGRWSEPLVRARAAALAACLAAPLLGQTTAEQTTASAERTAAAVALDRALGWLEQNQHPGGTWGTAAIEGLLDSHYAVESYYAWQVGAHALATLALLQASETPTRRAALERAVAWLCATRMPLRGSGWDNDAVWAWLYGTVACTAVAQDSRFGAEPWQGKIAGRGRQFVSALVKNQVPDGGFGYYDEPPYTRRPKWSTSFSTACVIPALRDAHQLGWLSGPEVLERATRYVAGCRLPNGAFEYDLRPVPRLTGGEHINDVKGSLGRIQVCQWALHTVGDPDTTIARIRTGVESFFAHHEFLQVARMRPIPHEAFYANAGYFYFFGHYYCALAIELLPVAEREPWHRQLRTHIVRAQRPDGSFCDFLGQGYLLTASTAFAALALRAGLDSDG